MMTLKKWFILLFFFIVYLLLGATLFFCLESEKELLERIEERKEREEILNLLRNHYVPSPSHTEEEILNKLSIYCGKPFTNYTNSDARRPLKWDFYHSLFFVITVVSTIGYGNLAPTTKLTRILMIFYGVVGIPINGIVFANLGNFFGQTFIRIYRKWKSTRKKNDNASYTSNTVSSFGLVSQIILYLIPGFTLFIFMPALFIMYMEDWDYVAAVYYAFVTLTTIGFGDIVAGVTDNGRGDLLFEVYKIFLLCWIIFGLGYLVMVLGFISRGMRSKKVIRLEQKLAHNIKITHAKIWRSVKDFSYLRRMFNELYLGKYKPVYRDKYDDCRPQYMHRSKSCPTLELYWEGADGLLLQRRRAQSESFNQVNESRLPRVQSDTDLTRIDKEATFAGAELVLPQEILQTMADALSAADEHDADGIQLFSDSQILASERPARKRAASEVCIPIDDDQYRNQMTWCAPGANEKISSHARRKGSLMNSKPVLALLERFKGKPAMGKLEERPTGEDSDNSQFSTVTDLRNLQQQRRRCASVFATPQESHVMSGELRDLIAAISSVHGRVAPQEAAPDRKPQRKLGTCTPPRRASIRPPFKQRHSSLVVPEGSRFTVRPVEKGSRRLSTLWAGPVNKQLSKLRTDRDVFRRTRHESYRDD